MSIVFSTNMTCEDVCSYLREHILSLDEDIIESFLNNRIDGVAFAELNDDYLKELCPILGDRMKLRNLVQSCVEPTSTPSTPRNVSTSHSAHSSVASGDTVKV